MRRCWCFILSILFINCGGSDESSGGKTIGQGPCVQPSDCSTGLCLEINGESYCSQECGSCPSGMYCDAALFGAIGLNVCVKGTDQTPVQPQQKPPVVPCMNDKDCPNGLVCATYKGEKGCTKSCDKDSDCGPIVICPYKIELLSCGKDESQNRQVCVTKDICTTNPESCFVLDMNCSPLQPDEPDAIVSDVGADYSGDSSQFSSPPGCSIEGCDGPCCPYGPCMNSCQLNCFNTSCQDPFKFNDCMVCLQSCFESCGVSTICQNCLNDLMTCADDHGCDYSPPSENECIGANCCDVYKTCF